MPPKPGAAGLFVRCHKAQVSIRGGPHVASTSPDGDPKLEEKAPGQHFLPQKPSASAACSSVRLKSAAPAFRTLSNNLWNPEFNVMLQDMRPSMRGMRMVSQK